MLSRTSSTKIPSAKPATPPGDGDTGTDSHWATKTNGTSSSATANPAQIAARSERRTATASNAAPTAYVANTGTITRQSACAPA